jgi:hypothetical protein
LLVDYLKICYLIRGSLSSSAVDGRRVDDVIDIVAVVVDS